MAGEAGAKKIMTGVEVGELDIAVAAFQRPVGHGVLTLCESGARPRSRVESSQWEAPRAPLRMPNKAKQRGDGSAGRAACEVALTDWRRCAKCAV